MQQKRLLRIAPTESVTSLINTAFRDCEMCIWDCRGELYFRKGGRRFLI